MSEMLFRKTYKRETAVFSLLWLISMVMMGAFVNVNPAAIELIKMMVVPIFGFVGAMFGAQVYQQRVAADIQRRQVVADPEPFRPIHEDLAHEAAHANDTRINNKA